MNEFRLLLATMALWVLATAAQAAPAISIGNLTGSPNPNAPHTLGWSFSLQSEITVTALGVFDGGQDGLSNATKIAIWESSNLLSPNLLAQTTISGSGGFLVDQFRYASISPIVLGAGVYRIGATNLADNIVYPEGQPNFGSPDIVFSFSSDPAIAFGGPVYVDNGLTFDLMFPINGGPSGHGYFGPNFLIEVTEPPSVALVGAALLGLLLHRVSRRGYVH